VAKLSAGDVVSVSSLVKRGVSNVEIARLLGVSEGAVRYQRKRLEAGGRRSTSSWWPRAKGAPAT